MRLDADVLHVCVVNRVGKSSSIFSKLCFMLLLLAQHTRKRNSALRCTHQTKYPLRGKNIMVSTWWLHTKWAQSYRALPYHAKVLSFCSMKGCDYTQTLRNGGPIIQEWKQCFQCLDKKGHKIQNKKWLENHGELHTSDGPLCIVFYFKLLFIQHSRNMMMSMLKSSLNLHFKKLAPQSFDYS